jgi:hypothetical protein
MKNNAYYVTSAVLVVIHIRLSFIEITLLQYLWACYWESRESEGRQPIKPGGQHRAWLSLLTSQTGEEIQWNKTDLGIIRVRCGIPRYICCCCYYYYYYYYYYYWEWQQLSYTERRCVIVLTYLLSQRHSIVLSADNSIYC